MSLLDEGSQAPETPPNENDQAPAGSEVQAPSWYWDEHTPGTGERPAYLQSKFKSVAEAAKSFNELEKLKGAAPNEYDFSQGQGWIEPDYEPFVEMAEFAKQKHVPQEVMDKFLGTVGLYLDEFKTDINEEKAKLGENASERLQLLNNWAKSNLSEKAFTSLSSGMRTADAIEALEEIRDKMINQSSIVPPANGSITNAGMTMEEYRSQLNENYKRYKEDPAFRKEMDSKLETILLNK